jgi:response regulator RpfG family c-di-GMP phosphodiesterase
MSTRLLVVDGSSLTAWLVAQVSPQDVDVVRAETFAQARRILVEDPPDAAIFNLTPWKLEWRALIERCGRGERRIPYLCTSAVDDPASEGLELPCRPADYFPKSLPVRELRARVGRLVLAARRRHRANTGPISTAS